MESMGKIEHHLNKEYKKLIKLIKYKDLKLNKKVNIYQILI
jgi:hypothetical protein